MVIEQNKLIDINEDYIEETFPGVLDLLLADKSSKKNIIWGTDNYSSLGELYNEDKQILKRLIIKENCNIIKPRIKKSKSEQLGRSRDMGEVFTPKWVCFEQINMADEAFFNAEIKVFSMFAKSKVVSKELAIKYILDCRMEVACGEGPYLTSRYDAVSGAFIPRDERSGIFDRKMNLVDAYSEDDDEWIQLSIKALQSVYGYDFQGDNVLLTRENILLSYLEAFFLRFNHYPSNEYVLNIANIISWNIWQMDGLKYVVPFSCHKEAPISLFDDEEEVDCPGCLSDDISKHNGIRCSIMDWQSNQQILINEMLRK